jgi:hypothetical protein
MLTTYVQSLPQATHRFLMARRGASELSATLPGRACNVKYCQILWGREKRWSYNSCMQSNVEFKSYSSDSKICNSVFQFSCDAYFIYSISFVVMSDESDPISTIAGPLRALRSYPSIHPSINGSTALFWGPGRFYQFRNPIHSRLDSLDGESARRKDATYTQNSTNTNQTHTDIHASNGIRTHDPSVRASEDSSCLRTRGRCDRLAKLYEGK